jgi:hypothetical protein
MALQDDSGRTDQVETLPVIKGAHRLSRSKTSAYPDAEADPPPQLIT